ncbi:hypothetical protein Tco_0394495 [Tanacetum coccineum]
MATSLSTNATWPLLSPTNSTHMNAPSPQPSPTPTISDSIPEPSGENLGDHSSNDQSLLGNEDAMTLTKCMILLSSLMSTVPEISCKYMKRIMRKKKKSLKCMKTKEKVQKTKFCTRRAKCEGTEAQSKEENASQTSTLTPTSVIFGDDETIATLLINMSKAKATSKEKEKGVELKEC